MRVRSIRLRSLNVTMHSCNSGQSRSKDSLTSRSKLKRQANLEWTMNSRISGRSSPLRRRSTRLSTTSWSICPQNAKKWKNAKIICNRKRLGLSWKLRKTTGLILRIHMRLQRRPKMIICVSNSINSRRNLTYLKEQSKVKAGSSSSDQKYKRRSWTHLMIGRRN